MRYLIVFLLTFFMPIVAQSQEGRGATDVFAVIVEKQDFSDKVEALGTLKANESIVLTANTTDTIKSINFKDGELVKKGTVLATMTDDEESALLAEAQSTTDEARLQLERTAPLVKQGAASQSTLDQRQREYDTAVARMGALQSRMNERLIIAPFDGVLGLRNISEGALVQPGTPITTLADLSVMKLDFNVPSVFLPVLQEGLPITAKAAAFGDREFKGTVSSIDSQINETTRSITVRALLPNDGNVLKPGLLMSVTLYKNQRETIVIPEKALVQEAGTAYVYEVTDQDDQQVAKKTPIKIGARRVGEVEILDGLTEGQMIVTDGTLKISDGAAIKVTAVEKDQMPLTDKLSQQNTDAEKPQETKE